MENEGAKKLTFRHKVNSFFWARYSNQEGLIVGSESYLGKFIYLYDEEGGSFEVKLSEKKFVEFLEKLNLTGEKMTYQNPEAGR